MKKIKVPVGGAQLSSVKRPKDARDYKVPFFIIPWIVTFDHPFEIQIRWLFLHLTIYKDK